MKRKHNGGIQRCRKVYERKAKRNWDLLRDEASKQKYKEINRKTKTEVAIAKKCI